MSAVTHSSDNRTAARPTFPISQVFPFYAIEAMATIGGTLMSVGIFFYMHETFHWEMPQNFMLAAAQGLVYVPGALLAGPVTRRFGPTRTLSGVYTILALLTGSACLIAASGRAGSALGVAAALLAYTFVIGISWPILEGLVASGGVPAGIARRVSIYNVIWPAGGAAAIAVEGAILKYWSAGLFLIPGILHVCSIVMILLRRKAQRTRERRAGIARHDDPERRAMPALHGDENVPHAQPEPELLRKRQLALWLSRTALPATYTVIYGLMPLMPSLPAMRHLPTTLQTVVASVWLITRWLAFVVLAMGSWWHTRPRALLWAAIIMLIAFFGMTLRPTHGASPAIDLTSMIAWQAVLGLALGMIYSGSLYFGMVLSDGSTDHGGYHEALIGLGWILGPTAGAAAQAIHPDSVWLGIAAVGAVIGASVLVVIGTALAMGRSKSRPIPA
jgi:MFS family permease